MTKNKIKFHENKKTAIIIITVSCFLLCLLALLTVVSTNKHFIQLNSLLRSDYNYSAVVKETSAPDSYLRYDAEIGFSKYKNSKTCINANIVMQSEMSEYSDQVSWNAKKLKFNEIAVSENIAKHNGLDTGDKIYSKHIVNDNIEEYSIAQIIPDVISVRVIKRGEIKNGIVIMGFDSRYSENLSHDSVVFTKEAIGELANKSEGMPEKILYRTDEIATKAKTVIPYIIIYLLLSSAAVCVTLIFLTHLVSSDYKRMIMIGFEKKSLKKTFFRFDFGLTFLLISAELLIIFVISFITGINQLFIPIFLVAYLIKIILLFCSVLIYSNRLWRG